ncbi:hypothetical protein B0H14DRAFT_3152778, partial [Mycena olivaceomarginata]
MNLFIALLTSFFAVAAANPMGDIAARHAAVVEAQKLARNCQSLPFIICPGGIDQEIACGMTGLVPEMGSTQLLQMPPARRSAHARFRVRKRDVEKAPKSEINITASNMMLPATNYLAIYGSDTDAWHCSRLKVFNCRPAQVIFAVDEYEMIALYSPKNLFALAPLKTTVDEPRQSFAPIWRLLPPVESSSSDRNEQPSPPRIIIIKS